MLTPEEKQICKDYFTVGYGVKKPDKPREFKKHGAAFWIICTITILPLVLILLARGKVKAAWKAYDDEVEFRRVNYPAKFRDIIERYMAQDALLAKALNKCGVDASEIEFFKPIYFRGQNFKRAAAYRGNDASLQTYSFVICTEGQIMVYELAHDFYADSADKEKTTEYFYRDVTNFKNETVSIERKDGDQTKEIESQAFVIVVPGDSYTLELYGGDQNEIDEKIKGLKALLRQKKM